MNRFVRLLLLSAIVVAVTAAVAADERLVGIWQGEEYGELLTVRLKANGSGDMDGEQFTYAFDGSTLVVDYGGEYQVPFAAKLEGDQLTLSLGEEYILVLHRVGSNVEPPATRRRPVASGAGERAAPSPPQETATQGDAEPMAGGLTRLSGIGFVREDGSTVSWCEVNPQTGSVEVLQEFGSTGILSPAVSADRSVIVFPVEHPRQPRLIGSVHGAPFELRLPPDQESQVRHPTVSRDGKLLAFTIRSSKHVGNVDVHDWNTGGYESTYMAIGTWYKVVSINLKNGEQQAVYHDDALVPDVMKNRGLGPVFSPTEDLLVYADSYRIYVCDAMTGKNRHTWEVPSADMGGWTGQLLVSEYSGLAFAPDGKYIAYLSQGQADIAIRPYIVAFVDVHSGQGSSITLPQEADLSGATPRGLIALDFSPDGRYLVFSASAEGAGGTVGPFLCVLDLSTGAVQAVDAVGVGAHSPVWKGR